MSLQLEMNEAVATVTTDEHRAAFIETAASLGAKVCRDALWAYDRCNWIGPVMEPLGGRWKQVHKISAPEFYGGTSGIALSLATLHQATGERVFRRTALGAIRQALARAEDIEPFARLGLYSGWFGIALAALNVANLLDDESLRAPALKLVSSLTEGEVDLTNEDVLAGCAGAIVALLLLRDQFIADDTLVEFATRLGDHLIETAVKTETGWSWGDLYKPDSGAFGNLAGYSHGAGGIGWALLELYRSTREIRFREAGEAAFEYERHWFNHEKGNWPDLRDPELSGGSRTQGPSYMNAWCHGAPGIALSRLRSYQILKSEICRDEAETAINTTLNNLYGNVEMSQTNYSLCHGLGGNCEPLICGAQILGKPELFVRAQEVALRGIESYEAQNLSWPCGGPGGLEAAGLMLGLSGISYYYLRMADPEGTQSLLLMSPTSLT
jgi:lantibiotic modifying enzyme